MDWGRVKLDTMCRHWSFALACILISNHCCISTNHPAFPANGPLLLTCTHTRTRMHIHTRMHTHARAHAHAHAHGPHAHKHRTVLYLHTAPSLYHAQ